MAGVGAMCALIIGLWLWVMVDRKKKRSSNG